MSQVTRQRCSSPRSRSPSRTVIQCSPRPVVRRSPSPCAKTVVRTPVVRRSRSPVARAPVDREYTITTKKTVKSNGQVDIRRKIRGRSGSRSPSPSRLSSIHPDTPHPSQLTRDAKKISETVGNYLADVSRPVVRRIGQDLNKMADAMDETSRNGGKYFKLCDDDEDEYSQSNDEYSQSNDEHSQCGEYSQSNDEHSQSRSHDDAESSLTQFVVVNVTPKRVQSPSRQSRRLIDDKLEYVTPDSCPYRSKSPLGVKYEREYIRGYQYQPHQKYRTIGNYEFEPLQSGWSRNLSQRLQGQSGYLNSRQLH
jgi:hypothetical protein